jgi:hypothetical protein
LHEYRKIEPEEIKEIQDEEKPTILDLEMLLTQYLDELEGQGLQLPTYITRSWRTEMATCLSSPRAYTTREFDKLLETGIVLLEDIQ